MRMQKFLVMLLLSAAVMVIMMPSSAYALCAGRCCNCNSVRNAIMAEVKKHQDWLETGFWDDQVTPKIEIETDNVAKAVKQTSAINSGLTDAQSNLRTLLSRNELAADAVRDSSASNAVCRFRSLSQSLTKTDQIVANKHKDLAAASLDRQLLKNVGASPVQDDLDARYEKFKNNFCDIKSYAESFKAFCSTAKDTLVNLDIDYTRLVDTKPTINTEEETSVIPMMNNLFANKVLDPAQDLMDRRALIAKRSVAENTFQSIIARRTQGDDKALGNIKALMKTMGVTPDADIEAYLTDKPSYQAQMDVLTKRLYQDAGFYKNLMDNPANLARQGVAMQSFRLMQQRDIYDSIQRSEILLSLIVEMELDQLSDKAAR